MPSRAILGPPGRCVGRSLPQPAGENGTRASRVDRARVGASLVLSYLTQESSMLRTLVAGEVLGCGHSPLTSSELREELQDIHSCDWNLTGLYGYSGPEHLFLSQSRALGGPA